MAWPETARKSGLMLWEVSGKPRVGSHELPGTIVWESRKLSGLFSDRLLLLSTVVKVKIIINVGLFLLSPWLVATSGDREI